MSGRQESDSASIRQRNCVWIGNQRPASEGENLILVAEDSEADIFFLLRAFEQAKVTNPVYVTRDGQQTLDYLAGEGLFSDRQQFPIPSIVLLDLRMPRLDGFEILKWKKGRPEFARALFVALSNSDALEDINRAYALGVDTFLTKPINGDDLRNLIGAFDAHWKLKNLQGSGAS